MTKPRYMPPDIVRPSCGQRQWNNGKLLPMEQPEGEPPLWLGALYGGVGLLLLYVCALVMP